MGRKPKPRILINFILDESASMTSIKRSTIDAVNEYIQTLKNDTKSKYLFSLTVFNSNRLETVQKFTDIQKIKELKYTDYAPSGWTPLYDAVYDTVSSLSKVLKKDKSDNAVITAIMTDGEENASKKWNALELKTLISKLEEGGNWTFVFMGANQDSWLTAERLGISKDNVLDWQATDAGTQSAVSSFAAETVNFSMAMNDASAKGIKMRNAQNFFAPKTPSMTAIAQNLYGLHGGQFRRLEVKNAVRIDELVEQTLKRPYKLGEAYYQLTKPEMIQPQKQIAILANNGKAYIGKEARDLLGLPDFHIKVRPVDHPNYEVYVQSTSVNRKLVPGTSLLVLS